MSAVYLYFTCEVAIWTLPVRLLLVPVLTCEFVICISLVRLLLVLHLRFYYLCFTCEVVTCALLVRLLHVPELYLWGCYLYFTCEVAVLHLWGCYLTLAVRLLPVLYLICCYLFFTCDFATCALPVRSSVWIEGLFSKMCRHLSAMSLPIISFRFGDDSTKQWLQAWLQYSPMLAWRISTFFFFKVSSVLVSV